MKLTFNYDKTDIAGSKALALKVGYQDSEGRWNVLKNVVRDTVAIPSSRGRCRVKILGREDGSALQSTDQPSHPLRDPSHLGETLSAVVETCGTLR